MCGSAKTRKNGLGAELKAGRGVNTPFPPEEKRHTYIHTYMENEIITYINREEKKRGGGRDREVWCPQKRPVSQEADKKRMTRKEQRERDEDR